MFIVALVASTHLPRYAPMHADMSYLGRIGLTATLFLIGKVSIEKTLGRWDPGGWCRGWLRIVEGTASLAAACHRVISV